MYDFPKIEWMDTRWSPKNRRAQCFNCHEAPKRHFTGRPGEQRVNRGGYSPQNALYQMAIGLSGLHCARIAPNWQGSDLAAHRRFALSSAPLAFASLINRRGAHSAISETMWTRSVRLRCSQIDGACHSLILRSYRACRWFIASSIGFTI